MNSKQDEDFSEFEATLQKIEDILNNKNADVLPERARTNEDFEHLDVDKVRLVVRENRTVINKNVSDEKDPKTPHTTDQLSFMREVERDANERAAAREKREREAEQQRSQGNEHFRQGCFEKAVLNYTKAVELVKDSAITYNNRALCYIRLRNYKRALEDCQYVLDKLQETNLRAWLYKATAHNYLDDKEQFEQSVAKAREHNPNQLAYIEKFLAQMDEKM